MEKINTKQGFVEVGSEDVEGVVRMLSEGVPFKTVETLFRVKNVPSNK